MKKLDWIITGIFIVILNIIVMLCTSLHWRHLAIIHHAAFYEVDSWGNTSFHWNDDSYAQAPFQDTKPWEVLNQNLFNQTLKANGIK
jgi:hypothetical protein